MTRGWRLTWQEKGPQQSQQADSRQRTNPQQQVGAWEGGERGSGVTDGRSRRSHKTHSQLWGAGEDDRVFRLHCGKIRRIWPDRKRKKYLAGARGHRPAGRLGLVGCGRRLDEKGLSCIVLYFVVIFCVWIGAHGKRRCKTYGKC